MFDRISNSWQLVKASWQVLLADKELIIFPIISGAGLILVSIVFLVPMFLAGLFEDTFGEGAAAGRYLGYALLFLFYLVQYFVIIFANSALVGAAMIRLDGGDPTVRDGLRIAFSNLGAIFGYALISATVGIILRWISERGFLGRLVASLFGVAWNIATYLAVPILVVEGVGPITAVKRSASLLKKTWGEQIVGGLSIGLVFGAAVLAVLIGGGIAVVFAAAATQGFLLPVLLGIIFIASILALSLISSTLSGIYSAAVYRYAVTGESDIFFEKEMIDMAFRPKGRSIL